jgi:hypothetical protein
MIKLPSVSYCIITVSAVVTVIILTLVPFVCRRYCTLHAQQLICEFERVSGNNSFFAHLDTVSLTIQSASWCPIFQKLFMRENVHGRNCDPNSCSGAVMRVNDAKASFFADPTSGGAPLSVQFTITGARGNYRLDFGDGQWVGPAICMEGPSCPPNYTIDHTYTRSGSFIAVLTESATSSRVGSVTVRVAER